MLTIQSHLKLEEFVTCNNGEWKRKIFLLILNKIQKVRTLPHLHRANVQT